MVINGKQQHPSGILGGITCILLTILLMIFPLVKEFWKSVKIWRNGCMVYFLRDTVQYRYRQILHHKVRTWTQWSHHCHFVLCGSC